MPALGASSSSLERSLDDKQLKAISKLVHERFGIALRDDQRAMIAGRIQRLIRTSGDASVKAWCDRVLDNPSVEDLSFLADRITTNHTYFHREYQQFDFLEQTALPNVVARRQRAGEREIRLWCAASSSGEESHQLAMYLSDAAAKARGFKAAQLATDLCTEVLETARDATYSEEATSKLPADMRRRHMARQPDGRWQVKPDTRSVTLFRRFNLMNALPFREPFDIIFCRNVMIYFDRQTTADLVDRLYRFVRPGGYLFVGLSEALDRRTCPFKSVRPGIYQKGEQ